jgi:hypothetical protein
MIKEFLEFTSKNGLYLPSAYDNSTDKGSVSLLFAHMSFYLGCIAICLLLYKDINLGTIAAMLFAGLYFIFYMLRRLTKAKIDLDDKSIDLENKEEKENVNG